LKNMPIAYEHVLFTSKRIIVLLILRKKSRENVFEDLFSFNRVFAIDEFAGEFLFNNNSFAMSGWQGGHRICVVNEMRKRAIMPNVPPCAVKVDDNLFDVPLIIAYSKIKYGYIVNSKII
jgi:hypothetical protein